MNKFLYGMLGLLGMLTACVQEDMEQNPGNGGQEMVISLAGYQVGGRPEEALPGEDEISEVKAYLFREGTMVEECVPQQIGDGKYKLDVTSKTGRLYVLANVEALDGWQDLNVGTAEEVLTERIISVDDFASHYFTSQVELKSGAQAVAPLTLKRGVARFDVAGLSERVKLEKLVFTGVAGKAYLYPQEVVSTPEGASLLTLEKRFETPLSETSKGLAYVYEQRKGEMAVKLFLTVNGEKKEVETHLDGVEDIRRNAVYTLQLDDTSGALVVSVKADEWGDGGETVVDPDPSSRIVVDEALSDLNGTVVQEDGTVLRFSHLANEIRMALKTDLELELLPVESDMLEVTPWVGEDGIPVRNQWKVVKKLLPPGKKMEDLVLHFRRKGLDYVYDEDNITFAFSENPVQLSGILDFDILTATCAFDGYIDDELGVMTVPEGLEVVAVLPPDEDPWLVIRQVEENACQYRVVAGWKPNDPKADGRIQSAKIMVREKQGGSRGTFLTEEYTVTRKNYGLPVVYLNGNWWCKYNALGTSRDFEDQILVPDDPAAKAGMSVNEYMKSCGNADFVRLWNTSYMGEDGESLRLIYDGSKFTLEGYRSGEGVHINSLDPKKLSPTGYEMPSYEDYNAILGAFHVPEQWGEFNPIAGGEYRSKIIRESRSGIEVDGQVVPAETFLITVQSIRGHGGPLTLYATGCQWNNSGMNYKWQIYACYKATDWVAAWALTDSAWLESARSVAANNTRVVRFKKSPVEYMYGAEGAPNPWE